MNQTKKVIIGILTFLPLVIIAFGIYDFFEIFTQFINELDKNSSNEFPGDEFISMFFNIFIYAGVSSIIYLGLMVYYIVDVFKTPFLTNKKDLKIVWTILIILFAFPAIYIYYFMYIVRDYESAHIEMKKAT